MKKLYQVIALFLVAAALFSVCGCSASKHDDAGSNIVGDWELEVDAADKFLKDVSGQLNMDLDLDCELVYPFCLVLNKDKSFEFSIDYDKFEDSLEDFMPEFIDAYIDAFYEFAEKNGRTKEQLDNEVYAKTGKDMRSYVEDQYGQIFDYDALKEKFNELRLEGYYKIEDDILYLSEDEDDFDDAEEWEFKLKGDTLTILSIDNQDDDMEEMFEKIDVNFPVKFTR